MKMQCVYVPSIFIVDVFIYCCSVDNYLYQREQYKNTYLAIVTTEKYRDQHLLLEACPYHGLQGYVIKQNQCQSTS